MFGFFKSKSKLTKFVQAKGGMHELYKNFVELFQSEGFQIREVTYDSIYLHYGSSESKVGIQLVQINLQEVQIVIGEEARNGQSNNLKLKASTNLNPRPTFETVLKGLKYTILKFHEDDIKETIEKGKEAGLSDDEIESEVKKKLVKWDFALNSDKVSDEMKDAIKTFLIPDNINPYLFSENMRIVKDGAFYYAAPPTYNGTESMSKFGSLPNGYPMWFAAGYPDVMVWFMDSLRDSSSFIYKIFSSDESDDYLEDNVFTLDGLRKLINLYKRTEEPNLECES